MTLLLRAAAVGVASGVATAAGTAYFGDLVKCFDTSVFYNQQALISGSLGVAAISFGAALFSGAGSRRLAIPSLILGVILIIAALVGPPYRTCEQFFAPV